ncbi:GNAT family N-acetyltransferase [Lacticaseibacillus daqingensis]|uniref:GNAT family N-acetyltransferase n=1 Tax=Lacticaseibacillus daqingensis TaxID=2486014 RepID=UPI0038515E99
MTDIRIKPTAEMTAYELLEVMRARVAVFVVEQRCLYQEVDGKDAVAVHVMLRRAGQLVAYARIVPHDDGVHMSFGRVLVVQSARHEHLATGVVKEALLALAERYPDMPVKIQAQLYLQAFYEGFGFSAISDPYLEDGIPHVDMVLTEPA